MSNCAVNIFMVNLILHSQSCQIQNAASDSAKCKKSWKTLHSSPVSERLLEGRTPFPCHYQHHLRVKRESAMKLSFYKAWRNTHAADTHGSFQDEANIMLKEKRTLGGNEKKQMQRQNENKRAYKSL